MAVNEKTNKSFAHQAMDKWPSHLETVEKLSNPPGELHIEMLCILMYSLSNEIQTFLYQST